MGSKEGIKKQFKTSLDRNKDGWEMATNWVRTFVDVYQCIFFLNSFTKLNQMACEQALRKITKKYLIEKDNVLDKEMMKLTERF